MVREVNFYRCEYERLRRKKNKEIESLKNKQLIFFDKTWRLLKLLGMPEEEILRWYANE